MVERDDRVEELGRKRGVGRVERGATKERALFAFCYCCCWRGCAWWVDVCRLRVGTHTHTHATQNKQTIQQNKRTKQANKTNKAINTHALREVGVDRRRLGVERRRLFGKLGVGREQRAAEGAEKLGRAVWYALKRETSECVVFIMFGVVLCAGAAPAFAEPSSPLLARERAHFN